MVRTMSEEAPPKATALALSGVNVEADCGVRSICAPEGSTGVTEAAPAAAPAAAAVAAISPDADVRGGMGGAPSPPKVGSGALLPPPLP